MSMMVQTSTDDAPELLDLIERRRAQGLDRHDEWWEGVYRIVTGPSLEHGRLVLRLGALLDRLAAERGLVAAAPVNIGTDKVDARVPDIAVVRSDTPRTSPAFLSTAELVVEILSPGERSGAKLPFYAQSNVGEYLEIDQDDGSVTMLAHRDGEWVPIERSEVVDLATADVTALLDTA